MIAAETGLRELVDCEGTGLLRRRNRRYSEGVGTIFYGGSATPIHIEDRAMAHLKVVIATKLRRSESFTVTWTHPPDQPPGRTTIWLHPSIPLRFVFDDPEPAELNLDWIRELAQSANSSGGIALIAEYFDEHQDEDGDEQDRLSLGSVSVHDLAVDRMSVGGKSARPALSSSVLQ